MAGGKGRGGPGFDLYINASCGIMRDNLGFLTNKLPGILKSIDDFLGDILYFIQEAKIDDNSLFNLAVGWVIMPNVYYLVVAVLQCAIPQALFTLRLILESAAAGAYADIVGSRDPRPSMPTKMELYAANFTMHNLVSSGNDAVREQYQWFRGIIDGEVGGIVKFGNNIGAVDVIYGMYDLLSKLIHPATRVQIGDKTLILGQVYMAARNLFSQYGPAMWNTVIPAVCDEGDLQILEILNRLIKNVRFAVLMLTYAWARRLGMMSDAGLGKIADEVRNLAAELGYSNGSQPKGPRE